MKYNLREHLDLNFLSETNLIPYNFTNLRKPYSSRCNCGGRWKQTRNSTRPTVSPQVPTNRRDELRDNSPACITWNSCRATSCSWITESRYNFAYNAEFIRARFLDWRIHWMTVRLFQTGFMMTFNEAVCMVDPTLSVKIALGVYLFGNTILSLGTERHHPIFKAVWNKQVYIRSSNESNFEDVGDNCRFLHWSLPYSFVWA